MPPRIHHTVTGQPYRAKSQGGRNKLPPELKLSQVIKGSITTAMREEANYWKARGYSDTLMIQLALSDWFDKQKSVQNTV